MLNIFILLKLGIKIGPIKLVWNIVQHVKKITSLGQVKNKN